MLDVVILDMDNYQMFRRFYLPAHFQKLQGLGDDVWGLGIMMDNQPAGVSLMEMDTFKQCVTIFYFTVLSGDLQYSGIELLLQKTEELMVREGYDQYVLHLQLEQEKNGVIDLLWKHGWNGPIQKIDTYITDPQILIKEKWISQIKLFDYLEVIPWSILPESTLIKLANGMNSWYPEMFSPFSDNRHIDVETSFALTYHSDVIGWIISEKVASNLILVKILFVRNLGKASMGMMALLAEVIKNAADRKCYTIFNVARDNFAMNNVVRKRLNQGVIKKKTTIQFER